ncbi:hypothetical protein GUJ93_ZPchr0013g35886 [Zizania palustris]|uniref:Uncharacterized protein n=1 Tax=Zizania palustris TaxID=103762 RepID=A0A8J5X0K7_ZIZPA|nr:hypothetical protein GUJ93_ZPchr0013g35886 [Zizania palustris]
MTSGTSRSWLCGCETPRRGKGGVGHRVFIAYVVSMHTRPGSLKVFIHEGARNLDPSFTQKFDMGDINTPDIVLIAYDVLKEDLCHDSDWHDGDRYFLRYQKSEKYMSVFTSKLLIAQKDFSASFTEVSTISTELQNQNMNWWLYALDCIEQNKDSADELIIKIEISSTKSTTGFGIDVMHLCCKKTLEKMLINKLRIWHKKLFLSKVKNSIEESIYNKSKHFKDKLILSGYLWIQQAILWSRMIISNKLAVVKYLQLQKGRI